MRLLTRRLVHPSRSDVLRIYGFSCWHLGNKNTDEGLIRKSVREIADNPLAWWFHLGDVCEYITRKDWRHDEEEYAQFLWGHTDIVKVQRLRAEEIIKPIAHKCLAFCEGNHEASIYQHESRDVYRTLAENSGMQDVILGHRGMVRVGIAREGEKPSVWSLRLYLTHGHGGGRKAGAASLRLEGIHNQVDGVDVVAMGHFHRPKCEPVQRFRPLNKTIQRRTVWRISVPSMCGDMRYAAQKDLGALPKGWAELVLRPAKGRRDRETYDLSAHIEVRG